MNGALIGAYGIVSKFEVVSARNILACKWFAFDCFNSLISCAIFWTEKALENVYLIKGQCSRRLCVAL